jgi:hypothetical protein
MPPVFQVASHPLRAGGQDADRCSLVWNEPIQSRPRIAARHSAAIGRVLCFSVRRRERNHRRARHYPCGDVATSRLVWQPSHSPGTAGRGTTEGTRLGGHPFQPRSFAKRPPFTSRRKHHVSRIVAAGILIDLRGVPVPAMAELPFRAIRSSRDDEQRRDCVFPSLHACIALSCLIDPRDRRPHHAAMGWCARFHAFRRVLPTLFPRTCGRWHHEHPGVLAVPPTCRCTIHFSATREITIVFFSRGY